MDAARFLINTIFIYDMYNNIYYNIMSYKPNLTSREHCTVFSVWYYGVRIGHAFSCVWRVFNTHLNISPKSIISQSFPNSRFRDADGRGRLGVRLIKV